MAEKRAVCTTFQGRELTLLREERWAAMVAGALEEAAEAEAAEAIGCWM